MADALIIDALAVYGTAISVPCSKGGDVTRRLVGDETDASAGNLRSSVLAEKRVVAATTAILTAAVKDSILARIALRRQVYCSGELFANVPLLCSIEPVSCEMIEGPTNWIMQLTIREV